MKEENHQENAVKDDLMLWRPGTNILVDTLEDLETLMDIVNTEPYIYRLYKAITQSSAITWQEILDDRIMNSCVEELSRNVLEYEIVPRPENIFSLFTLICPSDVRVIILGLDPYCTFSNGEPIANGISFSTNKYFSKSLNNIRNELCEDLINDTSSHDQACIPDDEEMGPLIIDWVRQGVLMLNYALTANIASGSGSHFEYWRNFTWELLQYLFKLNDQIILCIWGISSLRDNWKIRQLPKKSNIFIACHPSRPKASEDSKFEGCKHFSKINSILNDPINWLNCRCG